jgi:cytidylate kinase
MVELEEKGVFQDFAEVQKQVIERDRADMERKVAPLRKADDAIEIDSTQLTVEEVVEKMVKIVRDREASK